MALVEKGDFDDNPHIPEDYYVSAFANIRDYPREDKEAPGIIINFTVEHDGEEHEIPFFAPAKLSISSTAESSRLAENLNRDGVDLLDPVLDILECKDAVLSEQHKWIPENETEMDDLKNALTAVLKGKNIRVNVEDDQSGEESTVGKFSKVFDEDDGSGEGAP